MAKSKPTISRVCRNCGTEFFCWKYQVESGQGVFCSHKCFTLCRDRTPVTERFLKFVGPPNVDGCTLWTGSTDSKGYGQINSGGQYGKPLRAHRVAWEVAHGVIPDGLDVLHNCPAGDNPLCCNPSHLFLGTHDENMADKVSKGRQNRGESHGRSILTADEVSRIRSQHATDASHRRELAEQFGVSKQTIDRILTNRTWKHG